MRYISILIISFFGLSSCQAKNKTEDSNTTGKQNKEIVIGKNTLTWSDTEPLPDYSYKNYRIEPFIALRYKMPIELGEWLVLYIRKNNDEFIRELKSYNIEDSTYVSLRSSRATFMGYHRPSDIDTISIPLIDKDLSNPETMFLFKGFEKYNTHYSDPDSIHKGLSDYSEYWEGLLTQEERQEGKKEDSIQIIHYTFKYRGKPFALENTYILNRKTESEQSKDSYAHYIIFRRGDQEQCLIHRQNLDSEYFFPLEFDDLDGDGLPDLICEIGDQLIVKGDEYDTYTDYTSFVLFLSSEAEEGELLKHVATKTINYGSKTSSIKATKCDDDDDTYIISVE